MNTRDQILMSKINRANALLEGAIIKMEEIRKERDSLKRVLIMTRDALQVANDHLDYIGWGDNWERQAAPKIEEQIAKAFAECKEVLK